MNPALAEELRKLLKTRKLQAQNIVKATGLSKQYVSDIMCCRKNPPLQTVHRLEDAFDLPRNYLVNASSRIPPELIVWINRAPGIRDLLYRIMENRLDSDERVNLERGNNGEDTRLP